MGQARRRRNVAPPRPRRHYRWESVRIDSNDLSPSTIHPPTVRGLLRSLALPLAFGALGGGAPGPRPLAAQALDPRPSRLELAAVAGSYIGGNLFAVPSVAGRVGTVGGGFMYGARLLYQLSPYLAVEGSYARAIPNVSLVDSNPPDNRLLGRVKLDQFDVDAVLEYASPKEALYLVVGGGVTVITPEFTGIRASHDTKFAFNTGVGYKRRLSSVLGFRTDFRLRGTRTKRETALFCDAGGMCYSYNRTYYTNGELTAGLAVQF